MKSLDHILVLWKATGPAPPRKWDLLQAQATAFLRPRLPVNSSASKLSVPARVLFHSLPQVAVLVLPFTSSRCDAQLSRSSSGSTVEHGEIEVDNALPFESF